LATDLGRKGIGQGFTWEKADPVAHAVDVKAPCPGKKKEGADLEERKVDLKN